MVSGIHLGSGNISRVDKGGLLYAIKETFKAESLSRIEIKRWKLMTLIFVDVCIPGVCSSVTRLKGEMG